MSAWYPRRRAYLRAGSSMPTPGVMCQMKSSIVSSLVSRMLSSYSPESSSEGSTRNGPSCRPWARATLAEPNTPRSTKPTHAGRRHLDDIRAFPPSDKPPPPSASAERRRGESDTFRYAADLWCGGAAHARAAGRVLQRLERVDDGGLRRGDDLDSHVGRRERRGRTGLRDGARPGQPNRDVTRIVHERAADDLRLTRLHHDQAAVRQQDLHAALGA